MEIFFKTRYGGLSTTSKSMILLGDKGEELMEAVFILSGQYNFSDLIKRELWVRVSSGEAEINGALLNRHGGDIRIKIGELLIIKVNNPAVVLLIYEQPTGD